MADNIPIQGELNGNVPSPVENTPQSKSSAFWSGTGRLFANANLGAEYVSRAVGSVAFNDDPRNVHVPYDEVKKQFEAQHMDPGVIPKEGWSVGAMAVEMRRQEEIQETQLANERSGLSGWGRFGQGLLSGAGDPIFLALGPVAGRVLGGVRAGMLGRAALGATEGGTTIGAYEAAQKHLEGHDADIASWSTLQDMMLSASVGGLLHTTFGARPIARQGGTLSLDNVDALERSDAAAKVQGVPADAVVSPAGAVGRYQVMPETARGFGLKGTDAEITEQLKDPATNKRIAGQLLDQLAKRYGNDPEAIAVAYNAGPHAADAWIKAGRNDAVLPHETQGYLGRLRGVDADTRIQAASIANKQMEFDLPAAPFKDAPFQPAPVEDSPYAAQTRANPLEAAGETQEQGSSSADFINETRSYLKSLGREGELDAALKESEREPEEETQLTHDDATKAVEAAVRCGVMKGLTYGGD